MKILKLIAILTLLFLTIYCGAWLYMGFEIKKSVTQFYDVDAKQAGYSLRGDKPSLSGFPFKPVITYKKGFSNDVSKISFDTLIITALPFPNQPLNISINNVAIQNVGQSQIYEIDKVDATIIIPKKLPATFTKNDLTPWQKEVGEIDIRSLILNKNSMIISAIGSLGLDAKLQPKIDLQAKMTDYDKLIRFLTVETSELSNIQGTIALGILNSMAITDPKTNQKTVEFDIKINDRRLSLGPISAMKIPKIYWQEK